MVDVLSFTGGHGDDQTRTSPIFCGDVEFSEFSFHAIKIYAFFIDLVERDDERKICGFDNVNGFFCLRLHTVIRRDHQNGDIRNFCSARTHHGKRFMSRRVDKRKVTATPFHLIRPNVLRDSARFRVHDICFANRIEQFCFSMIHMSHHNHNRRTRYQIFLLFTVRSFANFIDAGRVFAIVFCLMVKFCAISEILRDNRRRIKIDTLIDARKNSVPHKLLHDARHGQIQK